MKKTYDETSLENAKANKSRAFNAVFVALALAATLAAVLTGSYFSRGYDLEIGKVSPRRFIAPKETINETATEKLRQERMDRISDVYREDEDVNAEIGVRMEAVFGGIISERTSRSPIDAPYGYESAEGQGEIILRDIFSADQINYLVALPSQAFNDFRDTAEFAINYVADKGVKGDGLEKSQADVLAELDKLGVNIPERMLVSAIAQAVIIPNRFVDEDETQRAREQAAAEVNPVVFSAGQKIVDKDEIITEDVYYTLEALGYTDKSLFENIFAAAGAAVVCAIVFLAFCLYVYYFSPDISGSKKKVVMLFVFYLLNTAACWALRTLPLQFVPILLFTMLISVLIDSKLAMITSLCMTIVCSFIIHGDLEFNMYFIVMGLFSSVLAKYTTERTKVFSIGVILSAVSLFLSVSMSFIVNPAADYSEMSVSAVYAVLNGVLTVMLLIGSLPLWEAVFDIVTPIKLLDLSNPSNELLRRLIMEAPGTYHHSLIVSNLAETAAYDISANALLAKVGGYYHDIGKLRYPDYFSENIAADNPHDALAPLQSVAVITGHVAYGLDLAKEKGLPKTITSFISEHHGTTLIKYFYFKAKELEPESYINEPDFRYHFNRPASKETAIVMMADTVEAAVRSMIPKGKPMPEVEAFVRELIKDKLDDGQLVYSTLTITELEIIINSFMKVFKGLYHERIAYPKAKS